MPSCSSESRGQAEAMSSRTMEGGSAGPVRGRRAELVGVTQAFTEANHGYGFVAEDVPELSIAVIASRRHEGIGRRLLVDLINASLAQGHSAISLSVREENPARGLYESAGFVPIEMHGTSWTMIRHAGQSH